MKMLLLAFRQSLEQDLLQLLKKLDVKAFTEALKVFGMGEAGTAYQSLGWPGSNSIILAAMERAGQAGHAEVEIVSGAAVSTATWGQNSHEALRYSVRTSCLKGNPTPSFSCHAIMLDNVICMDYKFFGPVNGDVSERFAGDRER